jgi:pilus assembly protein CpaD
LLAPLLALAACKNADEPIAHVAGWTLVDPTQRHPIMVSQQPASLSVRIPPGSHGLSPSQQGRVADFLGKYRASSSGPLVIAVPSGAANETAAIRALADVRFLLNEYGVQENSIVIEAYHAQRETAAPIRLSFVRFVAEGPECGRWTTNLAYDPRNLPYPNLGCAQQRNLAAQIAEPADLLGPRAMDPSDGERRAVVFDKYRQGRSTPAEKSADERVQVKGAN